MFGIFKHGDLSLIVFQNYTLNNSFLIFQFATKIYFQYFLRLPFAMLFLLFFLKTSVYLNIEDSVSPHSHTCNKSIARAD